MAGTLLASLARPLWRLLEDRRIDPVTFFQEVGLEPGWVHESRTRYPSDLLSAAWLKAVSITGDEGLGLDIANVFTPLDLNALGVTFLSSATLNDAFERLDRYETLLNSSLDFTIRADGDRVHLVGRVDGASDEVTRFIQDSHMAVVLNLSREGLHEPLDPVEVAFTYPEPASSGRYFGVFRAPILFSQPEWRLTFRTEDAQRSFTDANRELAISNDHFLDDMLQELQSPDIVTLVKKAVVKDLPSGAPPADEMAKKLHMSGRTLQRRLAEEGTNYRDLVFEVRRDLAEKYIRDRRVSLAEISYLLGFSDTSSFSRAFRRWNGAPPKEYRERLFA